MRIIFWQLSNSPHQFALLDALSRHAEGHTVELVVTQPLSDERKRMGWQEPTYENVLIHRQPSCAQIDILTRSWIEESVHIFSGLAADTVSTVALNSCIKWQVRIGIMAEGADWTGHGLKRYARFVKHALLRFKYGHHILFILAIGEIGIEWYLRIGYPKTKIHHFAYYIENPRISNISPKNIEILYVGRAIRYKGGGLLLNSLSRLKHLDWRATFVTQGEERANWEKLSLKLGLDHRVEFKDFEKPELISQWMASSSMLILPNIGDEGWGAVVNEALMQGTHVICTILTGAKDMVGGSRGIIVPPTITALTAALEYQIIWFSQRRETRQNCQLDMATLVWHVWRQQTLEYTRY